MIYMLYPERIPPPKIDYAKLPEVEREPASALIGSLIQMDSQRRNFAAAVILFESGVDFLIDYHRKRTSRDNELTQQWKQIAARDGAMTIYHFNSAMESISAYLGKAPQLRGGVRATDIRDARKRFQNRFKGLQKLRDAVAHTADRAKDLKRLERNSTKKGAQSQTLSIGGPGMTVMLEQALCGRVFSMMIDGLVFEYELSEANANVFTNVQQQIFAAFNKVT